MRSLRLVLITMVVTAGARGAASAQNYSWCAEYGGTAVWAIFARGIPYTLQLRYHPLRRHPSLTTPHASLIQP